jgi:pimeloyl-ACP methyl ester carboxylesterase
LSDGVAFVAVPWAGHPSGRVHIEHRFVGPATGPLVVFLHEGLGSLSMWRDFPERLCAAAGCRGLVYSRPAYGRSTPRPAGERWGPDFMHRQAHELLPALLDALGVQPPYALFGHSDGGSIALLHAARFPARVACAVVLAPHIVVEDISVRSIEATRGAYLNTDLRARLARHHADVDSTFWGWNDIWLDSRFRGWSIEAEIGTIACPLLAVQGLDDEYGTLAQIRGIRQRLPQTQLLELADCAHSPHRDQPETLITAAAAFIRGHSPHHLETTP